MENLTGLTKTELDKKLDEVTAWLQSPKGKKAMAKSLKEANERCNKLDESLKIDWRKMNQPMTI